MRLFEGRREIVVKIRSIVATFMVIVATLIIIVATFMWIVATFPDIVATFPFQATSQRKNLKSLIGDSGLLSFK